jgi:hypothetical protein
LIPKASGNSKQPNACLASNKIRRYLFISPKMSLAGATFVPTLDGMSI